MHTQKQLTVRNHNCNYGWLKALPQIQNGKELNNEKDESHEKNKMTEELEKLHIEVISSLKTSVIAAQKTFTVNFYVNVVIVIFGILLVLIAIVQSIFQGIDLFSITFGTLGVANFVTVFLLNPQSRLQENLCKLSQMNVILSNFLFEYDNFLTVTREVSDIRKLTEINKEGERIVSFTLGSICELMTTTQKKEKENEPK